MIGLSVDPRASVQIPFLTLQATLEKQATSEVASYVKHALLVQFEMFVFPSRFCLPLSFLLG